MERFAVTDSPRKMLMLLVVFVAALTFPVWVAAELPSGVGFLHVLVGIGIVLFALYIVIVVYRALRAGERIVIDDAGIQLSGVGVISWQDIEGAYL